MQSSAKVGLLVLVFIGLLYGAYSILGRSLVRPETNIYHAEFSDAAGTTEGTPVTMAGVKIGSVKRVVLVRPNLARLDLEIGADIQIPTDSIARIGSSLIGLGSNPVQVVPPAKASATYLADGDTIRGSFSSPIEELMPSVKDTLGELNATLAASRKLLEDRKLQTKLEKLLDSTSSTLNQYGALAERAQGLMARATGVMDKSQPVIQSAMADAAAAMRDVRKSTQVLAKLVESGKLQGEALTLLEQLNATAKKTDELMASLNAFVGDTRMQADLKETVANVNRMSDSGTRIAANSEEISKNGITLSQKAIELADKANAIADEAHVALQRITGFFTRGGAKPVIPKIEAGLDLVRETEPNHWRTDLTGRIPVGSNFVDIGLYDAFETNKVILQYGSPLVGSSHYRYGIYASKPGLGVDFRVAPRVSLRSDLFDINKPRFDLRTQLDFGNGFVGWLGIEKIFDRNAILAGVGIRK